MENKVYVVFCPDYSQTEAKIGELIDIMGGLERFVEGEEKILLKPNLLIAAHPEKAVTTHPSVAAAVGSLVKKLGAFPIIADSPGSGYAYTEKRLKKLYHECGMAAAAKTAGIELNFNTKYSAVSFPEGKLIKRFEVIAPLLEADGMINLSKLKTHTFMSMSGAVKNSYGVIPGRIKVGFHANLHKPDHFAAMLLDLSGCVAPRLSIMDAVIGMEGDGPHNGEPRQVGFLLGAANPVALDIAAGEIMGLPRKNNPILKEAEKRGQRPFSKADIKLIGADWPELKIPDFKLPQTITHDAGVRSPPGWASKIVRILLRSGGSLKPQILPAKCRACGACRDACPQAVITMIDNEYAQINSRGCIRCYCCHEMCQYNAIELRRSRLNQLINR